MNNSRLKKIREDINRRARNKRNTTGIHRPPIGFRLVQGKKGLDDRVIEINTSGHL